MTFLTELERLKSAATNGPWQALPEECDKPYIRIRGTMLGCRYKIANVVTPVYDGVHEREAKETRANAALICFLVNHADALEELVRAAEDALLALNMGLGQTEAQYEDAVKQAIKARDAITQALAKLNGGKE